jgi:calcineurin-like phosphoesterase family protein
MPIHLPPISRRGFLLRSACALAGAWLAPRLRAQSREPDPAIWALFSDTHLAANRDLVARGVNMKDHFVKAALDVLALPKRPAGLVLTGDCAYSSGQKGDYDLLVELLRPLREGRIPIHLVLGNHDHRERFWEVLAEEKAARRPVADRQTALLKTPLANWFILDSLEQTAQTPGLLGKSQLDWLAETLDKNPDQPALVVLHHNPGLSGNLGLKDTIALLETLRPRKQVKAYIYGHTHQWKVEQDPSGIHLVNLPALSYVFQEKQPTGWVLATFSSEGMRLQLRVVGNSHPAHGAVTDLKWRPG